LDVTITNSNSQNTGTLSIALSGANAGSFTLNESSISGIAAGGNDTFTIVPNTGLGAGTYTATVTVSGGHSITASFGVSFTVNPVGAAGITQAYWLNEQGHISFTGGSSATIGQEVVITAQDTGYSGQKWYVNGAEVASQAGQSSYTFTGAGKAPGKYAVGLLVKKGSGYYDPYYYAEFIVTVQ
jgi:hypothetical protein